MLMVKTAVGRVEIRLGGGVGVDADGEVWRRRRMKGGGWVGVELLHLWLDQMARHLHLPPSTLPLPLV